jgi:hypothetical protein
MFLFTVENNNRHLPLTYEPNKNALHNEILCRISAAPGMAIPVMEFQVRGYKIRNFLGAK